MSCDSEPGEVDTAGRVVCGVTCLVDRRPDPGDRQDPSAVRDEPVAVSGRSGVEDERAGGLGVVDPVDRRATVALRRVPLRSRARPSPRRVPTSRRPRRPRPRAPPQPASRGDRRQQRNDRLRLGVAEPAVELEHARPVRRQHQPRVQQPGERRFRASRAPSAPGREPPRTSSSASARPSPTGAIRAHASRVRSDVAVVGALEVLRRDERHAHRARRRSRTATPRAPSSSSTTTSLPAPRSARIASSTSACVWQTKTPFPAASPSAFTTHGGRAIASRAARRDAGRGHDLLRERLRALDPRRAGARPEDEEAEAAQGVGEPEHERHLGPDHDELDLERARQAEHALRRRPRESGGTPRSTRFPDSRARHGARSARRLRELPGERMLATTRPDDEGAHRPSLVARRQMA